MGKAKRGYNWEARKVVKTVIDDSSTSKIKLDLEGIKKGRYDQCNALVIPSKKRKTKKKNENTSVTKILSKKQRKHLEKIVEQKTKKENRANLLDALSKVQAPADVLKHLTSIAAMQTKGLKRHFSEAGKEDIEMQLAPDDESTYKVKSIAGSRKRRKLLAMGAIQEEHVLEDNPNIVGFQSVSDSSEDESDNATDNDIEAKEDGEGLSLNEDTEESTDEDRHSTDIDKVDTSDTVNLVEDSVPAGVDGTNSEAFGQAKEEGTSNKPDVSSDCQVVDIGKSSEKVAVNKVITPAVFVPVHRRKEIEESRMKLPILAEEQAIMEAIKENPVVIIAGETGSGKTTQVPQFLYEAGYASDGKMIGVTEPRRVAAISMATRVAMEMNLSDREVSYLIRFEGNATDDTKIKFMTDGVLLKEIQSDFLLSRYSVIILDEAHERSVYTDILIGLLSRIAPLRNKRNNPLKIIIMSATLRLEDFTLNTRLFKTPPPVIQVDSRQFPVTIHFNKRTVSDYTTEAYKKACKIHTQLPEGGILIFVTGQHEVNSLVARLRKSFPLSKKKRKQHTYENDDEVEENTLKNVIRNVRDAKKKRAAEVKLPNINLDNFSVVPSDDTDMDLLGGDEELEDEDEPPITSVTHGHPMWVLPLFSLLPSNRQAKVFDPPPAGCRLCVVATNVAETSLTIPGVKYVVDSGRVKSRLYDKVTGVSAFHVTWTSKAGANQRAGRAGRTSAGHCYRLYSSAMFNDQFEEFAKPEIQRKPVDDLVLQMKAMNIVKVVNFPFPSSPDAVQLKSAEQRLQLLGALNVPEKGEDEWSSRITRLGTAISAFPVSPRYGKMLALSHQHDLLPYTVCMVAALSVQEVLQEVPIASTVEQPHKTRAEWARTRRQWAGTGNSLLLGDPMVLLRAVGAAEFAGAQGKLEQFCTDHGLRHKAITEVRKLRLQLTTEINLNVPELNLCVDPSMRPPSDKQARHLRQILLSGMVDQVGRKVGEDEVKETQDKAKMKHAYRCGEMEDPVIMHSSSVLRKTRPEWVVYQEVFETSKMIMRGITAIEPQWLPTYASSLCHLSEPMMEPEPRFDQTNDKMYCSVSGSYGRAAWQLPVVEIEFPASLDRYKWFARFLLDGSVCPRLKKYTASLLSTPSTMVKTWANLQTRTSIMLKALLEKEVDSKEKLLQMWKMEPSYLLQQYQKWLPESAHNDVSMTWPPL